MIQEVKREKLERITYFCSRCGYTWNIIVGKEPNAKEEKCPQCGVIQSIARRKKLKH